MKRYSDMASGTVSAAEAVRKVTRVGGVIAGLCFLAYVLSMLVVRMDVYFVVLAGLAVVVVFILSLRFELGLLFYLFIAPFVAGQSPAVMGAESTYKAGIMPSQLGLVLLCLFWAASQALRNGLQLAKTKINLPIVVFFIAAAASIATTAFTWDPKVQRYDKQLLYQLTEVGLWLLCPAAFFLAANGIKRREWLARLFWPVAILGLYAGFFQISGLTMPLNVVRSGFLITFAAALAAARLFFGEDRPIARFAVGLLLAVLLVAALWDRTWVSGWAATILGVMFVTLLYSRRLFLAFVIITLFAIFVYPEIYHSIYSQSAHEGDLDRLVMWKDSARMAVQTNPLLGIGPASYMAYSRQYASVWHGTTTYTTAHSDYAQMIAEMGIVGIAAFLWLIAAGIGTGLDAIRRSSSDIRWLPVGATAVFASIAAVSVIGDYLLPSRVNGGIWTFGTSVIPWFLLGAAVAARGKDRQPEASA